MGSPRRVVVATMLVATSLIGVAALAASWAPHGSLSPITSAKRVRLSGHLNAMYPSRHAKLRVHVRNRLGSRVVVHRIHARVHRGVGPNGRCPAKMLVIRDWRGSHGVLPGRSRTFRLRVRMRRRAPDSCQGTRWALTYHARSVYR